MTDEDDLWEAFKAGFDQSAEGYNAEYGASEESVRQRFAEWRCSHQCGHDFGAWEYENDSLGGAKEFYRRVCQSCGADEYDWRDKSDETDA